MEKTLPSNAVVLQLIPSLMGGGAERTVVDMVKAIVKAGGKAVVASQGGRLVAEIEALGGVHITLPLASKNPFVMMRNAFRLKKVLQEQRVTLVHARSRAPAWSGLFAARMAHVPFITTYHGLYKANSRLKRFYNSVMVRGRITIANSSFTANHIAARYGEVKMRVINRGVDIDVFTPQNLPLSSRPLLVLPARLTKGKGHMLTLEALTGLSPRPKLAFVGEGDLKSALIAQVSRLNLQQDVEFMGHVSNMPAILNQATLVLAPSTVIESFGRVPIEAGACGKVCVVSRLGGLTTTVIAGETGFFCEAGDALSLKTAIEQALKVDLAAMGEVARKHIAQNFSLKQMCDATIAVYQEILLDNS